MNSSWGLTSLFQIYSLYQQLGPQYINLHAFMQRCNVGYLEYQKLMNETQLGHGWYQY